MAHIALPRHQVTHVPEHAGVGTPLYQRRTGSSAGPIELIPNPEFVFPARNSPDSSPRLPPIADSSRRPMSVQTMPASRRHNRSGSTQRKSVSALPDFSFNPGGASPNPTASTPPPSPLPTTPTTPSRNIGHRRGGSEFIGGDGKTGGTGLMSSSPTKGEGALPVPRSDIRLGPPTGRRGHAHKRSGAISCHDLSSILQPRDVNTVKNGSAPVTPMDFDAKPTPTHTANQSTSHPSLRSSSPNENGLFSNDNNNSPPRPPSRARVGFSDRVEYIRPLSTISSETESSLSTIRGHSTSNSLSSVISAGASSPPSRLPRPSLNTTFEDDEIKVRPSTAGAVLDVKSKVEIVLEGDDSDKRPRSAIDSGSPTSPKAIMETNARPSSRRRGFFRLDQHRSDSSLHGSPLRTSISEPTLAAMIGSPLPSPLNGRAKDDTAELEEVTEKKGSRRPRKVKSWASAILPRLAKHPNTRKSKSVAEEIPASPAQPEELIIEPNPPEPVSIEATSAGVVSNEMIFDFEPNFDVDDTVTIITPPAVGPQRPKLDTDIASWKPREISPPDPDALSPVIDLDAALGPFNTPALGPNGRPKPRGFSASRRQMHSGGFNFSSSIQPHRRTESAPELVPFEFLNSAMSNASTMADVFEEEEEEDEEDVQSKSNSTPSSVTEDSLEDSSEETAENEEEQNIGIEVVESDSMQEGSNINWNFDDGLGIIEQANERAEIEPTKTINHSPIPSPERISPAPSPLRPASPLSANPVEVVEDYEEPRTSSLTRSSDSTATPTMPAMEAKEPQPLMNLSIPVPPPALMTPDTFTSSSFSSPDFSYSQGSLDTPRLGTAASSVTDSRTINSFALCEPGPEFRVSVDDVPSLTSSRSTMTSGLQGGFPIPVPRAPGERSSSVCSVPSVPSSISERRRKRSSIASLSRLMNGTFGEKSKLSIEQRIDNDETTKPPKAKKTKRLSRLIHFWKPKESS